MPDWDALSNLRHWRRRQTQAQYMWHVESSRETKRGSDELSDGLGFEGGTAEGKLISGLQMSPWKVTSTKPWENRIWSDLTWRAFIQTAKKSLGLQQQILKAGSTVCCDSACSSLESAHTCSTCDQLFHLQSRLWPCWKQRALWVKQHECRHLLWRHSSQRVCRL